MGYQCKDCLYWQQKSEYGPTMCTIFDWISGEYDFCSFHESRRTNTISKPKDAADVAIEIGDILSRSGLEYEKDFDPIKGEYYFKLTNNELRIIGT